MRKIPLLLVVALLFFADGKNGADAPDVLRVRNGEIIAFDRMVEEVKKAKVIFIGEVHNVREHHRSELALIAALHESDAPLVIGLEMFRSDGNAALDAWVAGTLPLDKFLPSYYDNWREPWPLYRDVFLYAREHRIPLLGLNIPHDIAETVSRGGFASLSREQKKRLPPGISCDIDARYMDFIRKAYADHKRNGKGFARFCEAQMVWDKTMAWNVVEFLKRNPGRTMVVLAGAGHAWKRGIPEQVARLSPFTYTAILPVVPDQVEKKTVTTQDADYLLLR
jgi:uncharacterized iron-regulated protein